MPDLFHPVRVAIDGNEANCLQRVGSNVYAYQMLLAMAEIVNNKRRHFQVTVLLSAPPVRDMPAESKCWRYQVLRPQKLWTQVALPVYLFINQYQYDVFYTPGHYGPRWSSVPYISSVMDLAFVYYPELFAPGDLYQLENWTRYSVKRARKVVAISKYTKNEIVKVYHKKPSEIVVAYPALAETGRAVAVSRQEKILSQLGINKKYFLYLGTLQPRKNIIRIVEAFEALRAKNKRVDYLLVLAGKNGWLTDEIDEKIASSPEQERIVMTGFVNQEQKTTLLSNALATLNLGLYEGFGIPALESLAFGTLPIVANNTSLPEVVGSAGLSVNPWRVASIAKAMQIAARFGKSQRKKFLSLASRQVMKFSYQKSADLVLTAIYRLGRNK